MSRLKPARLSWQEWGLMWCTQAFHPLGAGLELRSPGCFPEEGTSDGSAIWLSAESSAKSISRDTCFSACGMASPCGLGLSQHGHWFPEGESLSAQADVIEDTWDHVCLILLVKAGHRASCDGRICKQTLPFNRRNGKEFVIIFDPQSQPQIRIISFLPCENCIHTSESILSSPSKMLRPKVQDFIIQNQVQLQMRFFACLLFPVPRSMRLTAPHSQYWMRRQKQNHCNKTFLSKGVLWLNELCAPQIPMLKH